MSHPAIVVAVADGVAPPVVRLDHAHRQNRSRPLSAIGAIEYLYRSPRPTGRCAITLTLGYGSPASSDGTRQDERSDPKPAFAGRPRPRRNQDPQPAPGLHILGTTSILTPDRHLCLDSCLHRATSDMLRPHNSPMGSVAI
jgi:hypothetical protein